MALRILPSDLIPALAAHFTNAGAVLRCTQLVSECLKHPEIFRHLSEPVMVSFSLRWGWLLGYLLQFLQMQMKWQLSFRSRHENSTPQDLCTAMLLPWVKRRAAFKNKGKNYVGIKKQNSAEKEHLWHWCSDSPGNLIPSSCHLLSSVPTIWLWAIKALPKSVHKIPMHRHKLPHDVLQNCVHYCLTKFTYS